MPDARRRAPLIFALVTAVAMVAAILAYALFDDSTTSAASPTYTGEEQAAVGAAQTEVANLSTFSRANFAKDFQRALNGLTGAIVSDIQKNKATTLKALTDGKFDLTSKVTHAALIGPVDDDKVDGYNVLVSLNGYKSTQQNLPTQQNLQVTVVKKNNKWLLSTVTSVGVSS